MEPSVPSSQCEGGTRPAAHGHQEGNWTGIEDKDKDLFFYQGQDGVLVSNIYNRLTFFLRKEKQISI